MRTHCNVKRDVWMIPHAAHTKHTRATNPVLKYCELQDLLLWGYDQGVKTTRKPLLWTESGFSKSKKKPVPLADTTQYPKDRSIPRRYRRISQKQPTIIRKPLPPIFLGPQNNTLQESHQIIN